MPFDPNKCAETLQSMGFQPCPSNTSVYPAPGCCPDIDNPVIHQFCISTGNPYTPVQYMEAYDTTKCSQRIWLTMRRTNVPLHQPTD